MKNRNKLIYWIATLWLSLGMTSTAFVQIIGLDEEVHSITALGYPTYFLYIIASWKFLGVITILVPGFPLIKEWAYAGFFFAMSGASLSRTISGNAIGEIFPSILLLMLTVVSWYYRPANRTLVFQIQAKDEPQSR